MGAMKVARSLLLAAACGVALAAGVLAPRASVAKPRALVISTLPFATEAEQRAIFGILSRYLARQLDRPVIFEAGQSYDAVIDKLSRGEIDVAFLGAGAYVRARRSGDVRAILRAVRHGLSSYYGQIITLRGSGIAQVGDLRGKRVAFVDRSSTAGYLYIVDILRAAGLDPKRDLQPVFAGGHDKVVRMVAAGEVAAGACFEGAEQSLAEPQKIVAIARSEPVPGDPVVVRAGLGRELVQALRSGLVEMATLPEAQAFFTFAEIDGFVPAADGDYDAVAERLRRMDE